MTCREQGGEGGAEPARPSLPLHPGSWGPGHRMGLERPLR